jgi:hypothetical protein
VDALELEALVRPETMRSSTSVSHASGSTPFSFAVAIRLGTIAQWRAPSSVPAHRLVQSHVVKTMPVIDEFIHNSQARPNIGYHFELVYSLLQDYLATSSGTVKLLKMAVAIGRKNWSSALGQRRT